MLGPSQEVSRALVPQGPDVIPSDLVDIYILPPITSFTTLHAPNPLPIAMGLEEQAAYLGALRSERDFLVNRVNKTIAEIPAEADCETVHQYFTDQSIGKLGIRNIALQGNILTAQHMVVPHPAYAMFSESSNPQLREFGANLGAALILVTADQKLIIQHRNPANRNYGDVPGASVAGFMDADHGTSPHLNLLAEAMDHLIKEGQEEIGLAPSVTDSFQLTSIQVDKLSLHHELAFFSRTSLASDSLIENALRNRHRDDAVSFRENMAVLDATPQMIERLLTEVHSPFPRTHAGALLMLGLRLASEESSTTGYRWLERVIQRMEANYRHIDMLCDSGAYTSGRTATDQGLPSLRRELADKFPGEHQYVECAW